MEIISMLALFMKSKSKSRPRVDYINVRGQIMNVKIDTGARSMLYICQ